MLRGFLDGIRTLVGAAPAEWDFRERRQEVRFVCDFEVHFRHDGERLSATVLDLGPKGLKLSCFIPPKPGQLLELEHTSKSEPAGARVLWVRKLEGDSSTLVGLGFETDEADLEKTWVGTRLRQLGYRGQRANQKRKLVRAACFLPTQVRSDNGHSYEGRIYDLGVGGALIEGQRNFGRGTVVDMEIGPLEDLPCFTVRARVVLVRKSGKLYQHGVEFESISEQTAGLIDSYLAVLLR